MGKVIDKENEVIEIVVDNNEISELINKLKELDESRQYMHFIIDKSNELLIPHQEDGYL